MVFKRKNSSELNLIISKYVLIKLMEVIITLNEEYPKFNDPILKLSREYIRST